MSFPIYPIKIDNVQNPSVGPSNWNITTRAGKGALISATEYDNSFLSICCAVNDLHTRVLQNTEPVESKHALNHIDTGDDTIPLAIANGTSGLMSGTDKLKLNEIQKRGLTRTNDTNITLTLGGTPATALMENVSMTLGWSGHLSVARGGTGQSSFTSGRILFGNGTASLGSSSLLFWDNTNTRLGVGIASPTVSLDVLGKIKCTGDMALGGILTSGNIPWARLTGHPSITIAGTENQIIVSAFSTQNISISRSWNLSLPQNIHEQAIVRFSKLGLACNAESYVLNVSGTGRIDNWHIHNNKIQSALTGARLEVNRQLLRYSVFDDSNLEKVAMGYLSGLKKNSSPAGSPQFWDSNHYGFWVKDSDKLTIDGDVEYTDGDWLIEGDATIKIINNETNVLWLGTHNGEKGLFLWGGRSTPIASFTPTSATVGGWSIDNTGIKSGTYDANSKGMLSGGNIAFYAGNLDPSEANFRVHQNGTLTADNAVISGSITVTGGNAATKDEIPRYTGDLIDDANLGGTANWAGVASIPSTLCSPSGEGLYLSDTHIGFYKNNKWQTYISSNGDMILGDAHNSPAGMYWSQNDAVLAVRGEIYATSGQFLGEIRVGDCLEEGTFLVIKSGNTPATTKIHSGFGIFNDANTGFYFDASGRFSLGERLVWDNSELEITGRIGATSGHIGGWTINDSGIISGSTNETAKGIFSNGEISFYAGNLDPSGANFRVQQNGTLTAVNAVISGSITVTGGNAARVDQIPTDNSTLTDTAGWGNTANWSSLSGVPQTLSPPLGNGLYLSDTHIGFYDNATWKTYISNTGDLVLGDFDNSNAGLYWNQLSGMLSIKGKIVATSGTIGGWTINNTQISAGSTTLHNTGKISITGAAGLEVDAANGLVVKNTGGILLEGTEVTQGLLKFGSVSKYISIGGSNTDLCGIWPSTTGEGTFAIGGYPVDAPGGIFVKPFKYIRLDAKSSFLLLCSGDKTSTYKIRSIINVDSYNESGNIEIKVDETDNGNVVFASVHRILMASKPTATFSGIRFQTSSITRLSILPNGQVGIGTTSPGVPLDVVGTTRTTNAQVSLGTVTVPSISFTGDTDTGIYSTGSGVLAITTNGTQAATFDASGNMNIIGILGVGEANPSITRSIYAKKTYSANNSPDGFYNELVITAQTLTAAQIYTGVTNVVNGTFNNSAYGVTLYGIENLLFNGTADDQVSSASVLCAARNYCLNRATGTVGAMYGSINNTITNRVGSITTSIYGTYNKLDVDNGSVSNAFGTYNYLEVDLGTVTKFYAVYNRIDRDGGTLSEGCGVVNSFEGTIGKKVGFHNIGATNIDLSVDPTQPLYIGHYDITTRVATPRITIATDGSVGIGTVTPTTGVQLDVTGIVRGVKFYVTEHNSSPIDTELTTTKYVQEYVVGIVAVTQPLAHNHGSITNTGSIGTVADRVIVTGTGGALTAKAAGTSGQYLNGLGAWTVPAGTTYSTILEAEVIAPTNDAARLITGRRLAYAFANITAATAGNATTVTNGVYTSRTINTTAPLSGGGNLSADRTFSLADSYGDTKNPYASKTAKQFLAAPNGTAGLPAFRLIVASDIPTLNQSTTGNAATATKLAASVNINGTAFDGSAAITTANWGTTRSISVGGTAKDVNGSAAVTWAESEIAASTAVTLKTERAINGVNFNGSAAISIPSLRGTNGTTTLLTTGVTSGVNYLTATNAIAGGTVLVSTAGADTNIGLTISTKGIGAITLDTGTGVGVIDLKPGSANVRVWDDDSSHYYQIVTGNQTANYNLNLAAGHTTLVTGTMVPDSRTLTLVGTTGQVVVSLTGAQNLGANRSWTLSLPQSIAITSTPEFADLLLTNTGAATGKIQLRSSNTENINTRILSISTGNAARTLTISGDATLVTGTMVPTTVTVTGTGSLGGGGALSSNQAISMNEPGSLTATTTNSSSVANHTHAISTAAAVGLSTTTTNAIGDSTALARSNHTHAVPSAAAVTITADTTNATGTSTSFARADHTHAITTGAATTLTSASTSAEGSGAALARASHTHAITNFAVSGTTNQVTVTGAARVLGAAVTLSLPQNIHTGATPQFAKIGIGVAAHATDALAVTGTGTFTGMVTVPSLQVTVGTGIGIGTATPSASFNINIANSFSANSTRAASIYSTVNITDAVLTVNRMHYGIYNEVINGYVSTESFTLSQYAAFNRVANGLTAGAAAQITTAIGSYNQVLNQAGDPTSNIITTGYGSFNYVLSNNANTITTGYGSYNHVYVNHAEGNIPTAYGTYNYLRHGAGTMTTAYGVRNVFAGTIGTKWGIHSVGCARNRLDGDLGLGANPTTNYKLNINGDCIFTGKRTIASSGTNDLILAPGGNIGIATTSPEYKLDVAGDIRCTGEFISTTANQARFIGGNFGVIHRNVGSHYYILLTASGDQYGSWNTLRPFTINNTTGTLTSENGQTFSGGTSIGANLTFTGARSILTDSTNILTLAPGGDLILNPGGTKRVMLQSGVAIQSNSYASHTTGWRVDNAGSADFQYITTNELHAKSFIADLEQALAGMQIICKSVAPLAANFTAPAAAATATLVVESFHGFPSAKVFVNGDIVRIRSFSRTDLTLTISDCWGTVTWVSTDTTNKTQTYTFTRSVTANMGNMAAGTVVAAGTLVLDYGATGNGFVENNAVDGIYAPYSQTAIWNGVHPAATDSLNVTSRLGNLRGIFNVADEYGLFAGLGITNSSSFIRMSNTNAEIRNTVLDLYHNDNLAIKITPFVPSIAVGTNVPTAYETGDGIWMGKDGAAYKFRAGQVASSRFEWDGTAVFVRGDANNYIRASGTSLELFNNGVRMVDLNTSGTLVLGEVGTSKDNISISGTTISFRDNTTVLGSLTSSVWVLGKTGTTDNNIRITDSTLQFRQGSTVHGSLDNNAWVIGQVGAGLNNIQITAGALNFRHNTTIKGALLADGTGFFGGATYTAANLKWDASGNVSMTGTVNAKAGNFTATVNVGQGTTAGTLLVGTAANKITIIGTNDQATTKIYSGTGTHGNVNTGFYMDAAGKFSLGSSLVWSGTALTIAGQITATTGTIGGWDINPTTISKNNVILDSTGYLDLRGIAGISAVGATDTDIRFWAGSTYANRSTAKFRVNHLGVLNATDAIITGTVHATTGTFNNTITVGTHASKISIIGAATAAGTKIFSGTGTYGNTNTGFYLDASGQFSLGNQLTWDNTTLSLTGRIQVTDPENNYPEHQIDNHDFNLGDATGWTGLSSVVLASATPDVPTSAPSYYVGRRTDIFSNRYMYFNRYGEDEWIPVRPGNSYTVSMNVAAGASTNRYIRFHYDKKNNAEVIVNGFAASPIVEGTVTTWTILQHTLTIPADTSAIRIRIHCQGSAGGTGTWYFSVIRVKPVSLAPDNTAAALSGRISSTGTLQVGQQAGITGLGSGNDYIRIWAGSSFLSRTTAPFRVTEGGALTATSATIEGAITANTGFIGGTSGWQIFSNEIRCLGSGKLVTSSTTTRCELNNTGLKAYNTNTQRVQILNNGSGWFGESNKFAWNESGVVTIGGWTVSSTTISSTGINLTHNATAASANIRLGAASAYNTGTGIWLDGSGRARFGTIDTGASFFLWDGANISWKAANTSLSTAGNLTATSATITGAITANTGFIGGTSGWQIFSNEIRCLGSGVLRTAPSGNSRVEISSTAGFSAWNGANQRASIAQDGSGWFGSSGSFFWNTAGAITCNSATIGGWTITEGKISSGGLHLNASATLVDNKIYVGTGTYNNSNTQFYVDGAGKFSLGSNLTFSGTALTVQGTINADTGNIGGTTNGWNITAGIITSVGSGTIKTAGTGARVELVGNVGIRVYDASAQRALISTTGSGWFGASNLFSWTTTGVVTIGGWTVSSTTISSTGINLTHNATAANANIRLGAATSLTANDGVWMEGSGKVRFGTATTGTNYFLWDGANISWKAANTSLSTAGNLTATSATITGVINANTGYIGGMTDGWIIAAGVITSVGTGRIRTAASGARVELVGGSGIIAYNSTPQQRVLISTNGSGWFGTDANTGFRWDTTGAITCNSATIGGWAINNTQLSAGGTTLDSSTGLNLSASASINIGVNTDTAANSLRFGTGDYQLIIGANSHGRLGIAPATDDVGSISIGALPTNATTGTTLTRTSRLSLHSTRYFSLFCGSADSVEPNGCIYISNAPDVSNTETTIISSRGSTDKSCSIRLMSHETTASNKILFGVGAATYVTINYLGQVGIGTTSPGVPLDVVGTTRTTNAQVSLGTVTVPSISFTGDTDTGIYSTGSGVLAITTNGTQAATFDASGNFVATGAITASGTVTAPTFSGALAATNLTGTIADARLSGTYSGFTHKIDGSNTVYTTPNSGSPNTAARTVYGLAEYRSASGAQVGAIVFIAPNTTPIVMHQFEISGFLYSTAHVVDITVQGYRNTGAWSHTVKISTGTLDVMVRWGITPSGHHCLILGEVGTTWSYPHFTIRKAMFSHNNAGDAYCTGWTVATVTDLSTYTNVTDAIANSTMVGNTATATSAATLGGASPNVSASNSTIVQRHSSGYIYANYLNTTANVVTAASHIAVQTNTDSFIRWATPASVLSIIGAAAASHANHVPTTATANNAIFLRNDNSWQTVTPANIGALPISGGTLTGNLVSTGTVEAVGGIVPGATQGYADWEALIDFGSDAAGTWRRIVNVVSPDQSYSTIGFKIDVVNPNSNHATPDTSHNVTTATYYVACVRTEVTTANVPDACYVSGPDTRIRAVKTATGTYQIQIQNASQYREYRVKVSVYAVSMNHTVTYHTDVGSAGTAQYNAALSATNSSIFQNITTTGTVTAKQIRIDTNNVEDTTDLRLDSNAAIAADTSISLVANYHRFYVNATSADVGIGSGTEAMRVTHSSGAVRVGIGTASPDSMLHVAGQVRVNGTTDALLLQGTDTQLPGITFRNASGERANIYINAEAGGGDLIFRTWSNSISAWRYPIKIVRNSGAVSVQGPLETTDFCYGTEVNGNKIYKFASNVNTTTVANTKYLMATFSCSIVTRQVYVKGYIGGTNSANFGRTNFDFVIRTNDPATTRAFSLFVEKYIISNSNINFELWQDNSGLNVYLVYSSTGSLHTVFWDFEAAPRERDNFAIFNQQIVTPFTDTNRTQVTATKNITKTW